MSSLRDLIKETADRVIAEGATPDDVREAVRLATTITIGRGGDGQYSLEEWPQCPYCGAQRGGGHGGMCPKGS